MRSDCAHDEQSHPPRRTPGLLLSYDDLIPGDILCFRPSSAAPFLQSWIKFCQYLIPHENGHNDTTHIAFYVGKDEKGNHLLAHITYLGFECHPIDAYLKKYDEGDDTRRPFNVIRFRHPKLRTQIVDTALKKENAMIKHWSVWAGTLAIFIPVKLSPTRIKSTERSMSTSVVCSTFAAKVIKIAMENHVRELDTEEKKELIDASWPHVRTRGCTPNWLEGYLYDASQLQICDRYIYPASTQLFDDVVIKLTNTLGLIENNPKISIYTKQEVTLAYYRCHLNISRRAQIKRLNDLTKSLYILKEMLPIIERYLPTHRKEIIDFIRSKGIFYRDVDFFSFHDEVVSAPSPDSGKEEMVFIEIDDEPHEPTKPAKYSPFLFQPAPISSPCGLLPYPRTLDI